MQFDDARIINAAGTLTRLSGAPLAPGVLEAMAAIEDVPVDMAALQALASRKVAAATGAEAGFVTSGAAAGLLLAAAAAMARLDVARMNALPETSGPNEILIARGHRNGYDHAARAAGAHLVEIGLPETGAGAGGRDSETWEYMAAIGPQTAAILYVATASSRPRLKELTALARAQDIPVIVDAAAELPPAANLRGFIADGADIVLFSGGKILGGPSGSGLICGSRDLIMSAALQSLDMDVDVANWAPPEYFIDPARLPGLPRQGIGRSCKVGKHDVAGLLAALDHFLSESDEVRHARWLAACETVAAGLEGCAGFKVSVIGARDLSTVPLVRLDFVDEPVADVVNVCLLRRPVPIHLIRRWQDRAALFINPVCLRAGEATLVAEALRDCA